MIKDRMGNVFATEKQIPDYGSLLLIKERSDGIDGKVKPLYELPNKYNIQWQIKKIEQHCPIFLI